MTSMRAALLACLLLLLTGTGSSARPAAVSPALPRFVSGACPFTLGLGLVQGRDVRCGSLLVPEDRRHPTGRRVVLAVAIFKSPSAHPAPEPLIYLSGGPGSDPLVDLAPLVTARNIQDVAGRQDFILLDQRGTDTSTPSLDCAGDQAPTITQTIRQCHDDLVGQGIDLNAYTTLTDAADVADLRRALGDTTVDLLGVSYGTRLALTVMRLYPTGIRSVILDSVLAPGVNLFTSKVRNAARAIAVLFQGCAHDPACARAYPHVPQDVDQLVTRLNAHPLTVRMTPLTAAMPGALRLTGDGLAHLLFEALYDTALIPTLPAMIARLHQGDARLLAQVAARVSVRIADGHYSTGLYYSIECSESAPSTSPRQLDAVAAGAPAALRAGLLAPVLTNLSMCAIWHVPPHHPPAGGAVPSGYPHTRAGGAVRPHHAAGRWDPDGARAPSELCRGVPRHGACGLHLRAGPLRDADRAGLPGVRQRFLRRMY